MKVLKARLLERALEEKEARAPGAQGRARRGRLGQPDPELRPAPVPDGQGPADRTTRRATRRPSSTATSTRSCRPSSSGWRPTSRRREDASPGEPRIGHAAGRTHRRSRSARPRSTDLPECAAIWRESINDYLRRLDQPRDARRARPDRPAARPHPVDRPGPVRGRDDVRREAASGSSASARRSSAARSGSCRCCSSGPEAQGQGLGRALLERLLPGPEHDGVAGDRRRQPPADLDGALRPVRDRAADADPRPAR